MSGKKTVRKTIIEKLEKEILDSEAEEIRKTLTTNRVQILFLDSLEWVDEAIALAKEQGVFKGRLLKYSTGKNKDKYLKTAQDLARKKYETYKERNKDKYVDLTSHLQFRDPKTFTRLGKDVFILGAYSTVSELKREILKAILRPSHLAVEEEISARADVAHGAETGTAVSMMRISKAASSLRGSDLSSIADAAIKQASQETTLTNLEESLIKQLIVNYEFRYDSKGNLQAGYYPYVTFQDRKTNRGRDAAREKFLANIVTSFFEKLASKGDILEISGSDSIEVLIAKVILESIEGKKRKNKKVTRDSKYKGKRVSGKGTEKGRLLNSSKRKTTPKKPKRITSIKNTVPNLQQLIGILNEQLPRTVAKNMGDPRLNYRTGRFAASVQVTDIATTAKGFPSVGYTYMKYPYQTFEPGYRQGSVDRDPRKLIDSSIREIAAQFAIGRFYTRRA